MKTRILRLLSIGLFVLGVSGVATAQGRGNGNNGNGNGNGGSNGNNGNNGNGNGNGNTPASVPEIDPSGAAVAAALLAGGLLVIRARRKANV